MYRKPYIYYITIFVDLLLRFLWIASLIPQTLQAELFGNYLSIQLGYLEILRRAMWGVFRVEWKHIVHEHIVHENKNEFGFYQSVSGPFSTENETINSSDDIKPHFSLLLTAESGHLVTSSVLKYRHELEYINDEDEDIFLSESTFFD